MSQGVGKQIPTQSSLSSVSSLGGGPFFICFFLLIYAIAWKLIYQCQSLLAWEAARAETSTDLPIPYGVKSWMYLLIKGLKLPYHSILVVCFAIGW